MSRKFRVYGGKGHRKPRSVDPAFITHWTCPDCGKQTFRSRADAKASARYRFPEKKMRYYECGEEDSGKWHMTSYSSARIARWREFNANGRQPYDVWDGEEEQAS